MKNYFHPHYVNVILRMLFKHFWTITNNLSMIYWGIQKGSNNYFLGKTIFRKLPNTKISIGNNCTFNSSHRSNLIGVYSPCMISTIEKGAIIDIGNHCGFSGTVIASALKIKIGNNVRCGANTLITDSDWHTDDYRVGRNREIIIEDNVWLGYGVKVLKGVHIGKNSLIGAGSIVTRDIPENVIAAGNPCKIIKDLK